MAPVYCHPNPYEYELLLILLSDRDGSEELSSLLVMAMLK